MIISKNQFFATLSKYGEQSKFSSMMLSDVPAPVKYLFDSTYEWDMELPAVQDMLAYFVSLGMVSEKAADEMKSTVNLDIRPKTYDMTSVSGDWTKIAEESIQPKGEPFSIDAVKNVVTTNGVLPFREVV